MRVGHRGLADCQAPADRGGLDNVAEGCSSWHLSPSCLGRVGSGWQDECVAQAGWEQDLFISVREASTGVEHAEAVALLTQPQRRDTAAGADNNHVLVLTR